MSGEYLPTPSPFIESTFDGRPIIARWGPSLVHIADSTRHVDWAMLVDKRDTPAKTLVWSEAPWDLKTRSVSTVQANRDGVFVARHPIGVPIVVIEDWTYQDDQSGVTWG
jgi:hypothetical protein